MIAILLFTLAAALSLSAQEKVHEPKTNGDDTTAAQAREMATRITRQRTEKPKAVPVNSTNPSFTVFEVFNNLLIAPGQTLTLTSTQDWTGADHASIAIECPSSTSLQKVAIAVTWSIPIANFYTITDVILGNNFLLPYQGGAVVSTYGNIMQTVVVNTGSTTVVCDQLTVYAVVARVNRKV